MDVGVGSQAPENASQNMGAEYAVAIVVAVDGDPLPFPNCLEDAIDRLFHERNGDWVGKVVPGWIFQKCVDVFDATSGDDIEQRGVEKHCFSSQNGIVGIWGF
jgi:hypothetical protein